MSSTTQRHPGTLLIVGASLAGAKAAEAARDAGFDGRVVLVGDEPAAPYERPPLSKAVLRGEAAPESARVHDDGFYEAKQIELLTGRTVEAIDPAGRRARLAGGEDLPFTAAILATGAAPRSLTIPGAGLAGIRYLRSVDDAVRLADAIRGAGRVGVIGAGWIGSEVAASARQMGADVVLIDPSPTPLQRVLGPSIGGMIGELHADHGVTLRTNAAVVELRGSGRVEQIVLGDGTVEDADVVVAGIGVTPRVELATAAGLTVENGIVVDEHLESSVPGIFAAGDVASAWNPHYGRHLRVEHWANALHQGETAGANAAGARQSYERLPYFFSDQYDLGLEYYGYADPGDALVVRGSLADRELIAFWQRDGVLTAAMNVNVWDVADDLYSLVAGKGVHDPDHLADPGIAVGDLAGLAAGRRTLAHR
jgi:3-phenylpropionate/trans-cinnamate dioxygenase ferredoxin reductase subunit